MCVGKTPKAPAPEPEKEKQILISRNRFKDLMIPSGRSGGGSGSVRTGGFGSFTGLNIPI